MGGKLFAAVSEGRGEPECREYVDPDEPGDLDHQFALKPKDVDPERTIFGVARAPNVSRHRRLPVGGGRHGPELTQIAGRAWIGREFEGRRDVSAPLEP